MVQNICGVIAAGIVIQVADLPGSGVVHQLHLLVSQVDRQGVHKFPFNRRSTQDDIEGPQSAKQLVMFCLCRFGSVLFPSSGSWGS